MKRKTKVKKLFLKIFMVMNVILLIFVTISGIMELKNLGHDVNFISGCFYAPALVDTVCVSYPMFLVLCLLHGIPFVLILSLVVFAVCKLLKNEKIWFYLVILTPITLYIIFLMVSTIIFVFSRTGVGLI